MNIPFVKITNPLLQRVVVFLSFFVIISGVIGSQVISGNILFRDGFAIYGGLGKATIFGLIAFVLLARHKKYKLRLQPWEPKLLGWLILTTWLTIVSAMSVSYLIAGENTSQNILLAHSGLLLSVMCAALGIFGPKNIVLLIHTYLRELIYSSIISALFYLFLLGVYALWEPLAGIVLYSVQALLPLAHILAELIPPNTLLTDKFGITVAEFCSGIESIALFSGLYIVVGLLEHRRLNMHRFLMLFPLALIVLFCLNIVRVFALIVAGYYINADIAFSLFHTYAGMVFFILYSMVFWSVAYKYLLNSPQEGVAS